MVDSYQSFGTLFFFLCFVSFTFFPHIYKLMIINLVISIKVVIILLLETVFFMHVEILKYSKYKIRLKLF